MPPANLEPPVDPEADWANYLDFLKFASTPRTQTYPLLSPATADLRGKSVLVTGASQGVGKRTALTFARAGCSNIAISSRSDETLPSIVEEVKQAARDAGRPEPRVLPLRLDVTLAENVRTAAEAVTAAFGTLDVLVNNAGSLESHNLVHDSDPLDWWNAWEVNIKGTYLVTKYLLPVILESSLKTVVNMTSGLAIMLVQGYSSYGTSKMAICRFTEFLASEYGKQGLITYALEPGLAESSMAKRMHPMLLKLPLDDPELAPETLVWLVKERRECLSGRIVSARWDMEEILKRKDDIMKEDLMKFKLHLG